MKTLQERFAEKYVVNEATGCWDWQASKNLGYGQIGAGGRKGKCLFAHRVSYELNVGQIPKDLVIDHVCRNRSCVNPNHLRLLTRGANVMCGNTLPAKLAAATRCPNGHEYTEGNIYRYRGKRMCRECRRAADRKRNG